MCRDKYSEAVGGNRRGIRNQQRDCQPAEFTGEVAGEGEVEAEKTNNEEVHASTGRSHDEMIGVADEARALLVDEIDSTEESSEPCGWSEDPEELGCVGTGVEGLEEVGYDERDCAADVRQQFDSAV